MDQELPQIPQPGEFVEYVDHNFSGHNPPHWPALVITVNEDELTLDLAVFTTHRQFFTHTVPHDAQTPHQPATWHWREQPQ